MHKRIDAEDNTSDMIKEINSNQMIVAALIPTVTFAAAFQVPGGYNSNDGTATLAKKAAFQVFVVTDAIAWSCSMTAVFLCFIFTLTRNSYIDSNIDEELTIMFFTILILIAIIAMFAAFVAGLEGGFAADHLASVDKFSMKLSFNRNQKISKF
ncbi:hypothetical protein HHK36_022041 [Tetracentron sinense]|uniref:PGG domain-containing protein n=1 Tax=Tetracentron sinense TaxID=13715 RepID=A0A834YTR8_TETSI|nr:hypothetical protein HHK36_022041 [Tetracentron sinense]